jgi:hypothetical protein
MNKGKYIFVGGNPVGYGLAERAGFYEKGSSTDCCQSTAIRKDRTDGIYWSSSEYSNSYAGIANFASDGYLYLSYNLKVSYYFRVRPVIAFLKRPINNKNK